MSVVDTTNVIDNSIFLKAKLKHNMVGDNYYIENLQDKRDAEWEYRYNVVDIEEELNKQSAYTKDPPVYTPIEAVITNVKSEKGEALGTDWASLSFKDLGHYCAVGSRYRFSLDFPDMTAMSEEDKKGNTSIWLALNKAPIHGGNSCVVRRCNGFVSMLGYKNRDPNDTSSAEVHYEPVIIQNENLRYMQVYYNQTLSVPQSEWYVIAQLNYFTNSIRINDRFIFGVVDTDVRDNNLVYRVKAIVKSNSNVTFASGETNEIQNVPLIILAIDRDAVSASDDFIKRIPNNAPIYLIPEFEGDNNMGDEEGDNSQVNTEGYVLKETSIWDSELSVGESQEYTFEIMNGQTLDNQLEVEYEVNLTNKKESEWSKYFRIGYSGDNRGFTVTSLRSWAGGPLVVKISYLPENSSDKVILKGYMITLKASY